MGLPWRTLNRADVCLEMVFLADILKDYGYIEHLGMGVPDKDHTLDVGA